VLETVKFIVAEIAANNAGYEDMRKTELPEKRLEAGAAIKSVFQADNEQLHVGTDLQTHYDGPIRQATTGSEM
jgi:hypothetical protein